MESTVNLMIFCGIRRKFYKFHGKQQNAMANLERGAGSMSSFCPEISEMMFENVDGWRPNTGVIGTLLAHP